MANAEVGSAYVSVIPSTKGFNKGVATAAFDGMKTAALGVTAAVAAIGVTMVAIGKQSLDAYANFEQLSGGVEKIFGEASSQVMANAQAAYAVAGVSMNQYMDQLNSMGAALKQSFGGDVVAAARAGNMAITDMADNASIFGSNLQDIQNAYQGFAKQNYTMLDNLKLGYGGTKQEMERLIADANAFEKAQGRAGDLTIEKYGDIVQAIHDIQEQQGIMGNSAEEAAETIQGSIQMMQASWENWLTALGDPNGDIEGMSEKLLKSIGTVAKNLIPTIARITKGLFKALPDVAKGIGEELGNMLSAVVESLDFKSIASGMFSSFTSAAKATDLKDLGASVAEKLTGSIESFLSDNQVAIGDFIDTTGFDVYGVADSLEGLISSIEDFAKGIGDSFNDIIENTNALDEVNGIFKANMEQVSLALEFFMDLLSNILNVLTPFIEPLMELGVSVLPLVRGAMEGFNGVLSFLIDTVNGVFYALQPLIDQIAKDLTACIQSVTPLFKDMGDDMSQAGSDAASFGVTVREICGGLRPVIEGLATVVHNGMSGIAAALSLGTAAFLAWKDFCYSIGDGIKNNFNNMVSFISGIPGRIKSFFAGLVIQLPHIKVPVIKISGSFSIAPPSVPHFSIEWYAEGGILTKPTMFGMNGSRPMVGGEAGPEAILPIDNIKGYMVDAMNESNHESAVVAEIRNMREDLKNMKLYMDARLVGGVVSPYVDANLGAYKVVASR